VKESNNGNGVAYQWRSSMKISSISMKAAAAYDAISIENGIERKQSSGIGVMALMAKASIMAENMKANIGGIGEKHHAAMKIEQWHGVAA
jgi:hypothetical protein